MTLVYLPSSVEVMTWNSRFIPATFGHLEHVGSPCIQCSETVRFRRLCSSPVLETVAVGHVVRGPEHLQGPLTSVFFIPKLECPHLYTAGSQENGLCVF